MGTDFAGGNRANSGEGEQKKGRCEKVVQKDFNAESGEGRKIKATDQISN